MSDIYSGPHVTGVKNLPLTMGGFDKLIGRVDLDYETGEIKGTIDKKLIEILAEGLGENLLAISFYGRPTASVREAHEKFREYLNG